MKYQVINKTSLVDGPGVRCALYVSGCSLRCKGCHNTEAWDFNCGKEFTENEISEILNYLSPSYIKGFSLLGGEPFDQNQDLLIKLLSQIKENYPNKDIWCWTGYDFDQIKNKELTKYIDIAVCGPFKLELRDISANNPWRGSTNQYVIAVEQSLAENKSIPLLGILNNNVPEN
jgi:anaerobic ribonucleoside-triphosphate reductase activating protein